MIKKDNIWRKNLWRLEFRSSALKHMNLPSGRTSSFLWVYQTDRSNVQDLIFGPQSEAEGGGNAPHTLVANSCYKPKRKRFFKQSGTSCQPRCFLSLQPNTAAPLRTVSSWRSRCFLRRLHFTQLPDRPAASSHFNLNNKPGLGAPVGSRRRAGASWEASGALAAAWPEGSTAS